MSTQPTSGGEGLPFSGNEIKRLGNRLRDGSREEKDIQMLEELRASFDPLLICMSARVDELLAKAKFRFLLSGRSKRTKSIIRKLQRSQNHGMDLSRMGDLVGLRVILPSLAEQDRALKTLTDELEEKRINDYRSGERPYRSVHVVVKAGAKMVEIQLRTLPQHVWAVESEIFGEQVKEGNLSGDVGLYLTALSKACADLDSGKDVREQNYPGTPLLEQRMPISGMHTKLTTQFADATKTHAATYVGTTFLVVFDNELRQLLHNDSFAAADRNAAIERFRWLSHTLSDTRFETLIFNSSSSEALAVTHPRFFE